MSDTATVIQVHRGGCDVLWGEELCSLRLTGRHAERSFSLAVGDEISFDAERGVVLERSPRRTRLSRRRKGEEHVIASNMDQVVIVSSFFDPEFRAGVVDRFQLAAYAGGLDVLLIVNKLDLLAGEAVPDSVRAYESILPVVCVSARSGVGLEELRARLATRRSVLAGHSGVGKSSLINILDPSLRLETGEVTTSGKGRHTSSHTIYIRLDPETIVVDTPGVREIASGPVDGSLLDRVYPDVAAQAEHCRFRDCRHMREPDCCVRAAVDRGELAAVRLSGYQRLCQEIRDSEADRSG